MRIEDAKELLEDSIKPIVDKFCRSTGILICSIDIHSIDTTNVEEVYPSRATSYISLSLDY